MARARRPVFLASLIGACAALVGMALLPPYPWLAALVLLALGLSAALRSLCASDEAPVAEAAA